MVGIRFEDRAQINDLDAQGLQVIQLFGHAPKVAAEKDVIGNGRPRIRRILRNAVFPIGIDFGIVTRANRPLPAAEPVHEYMIHHALAKPGRGVIGVFKNQKTESCSRRAGQKKVHVVDALGKHSIKALEKQELVIEKATLLLRAAQCFGIQLNAVYGIGFILGVDCHGNVVIPTAIAVASEHNAALAKRARYVQKHLKDVSVRKSTFARDVLAIAIFMNSDTV